MIIKTEDSITLWNRHSELVKAFEEQKEIIQNPNFEIQEDQLDAFNADMQYLLDQIDEWRKNVLNVFKISKG